MAKKSLPKHVRDNRSDQLNPNNPHRHNRDNQLNPNNSAYWKASGLEKSPGSGQKPPPKK